MGLLSMKKKEERPASASDVLKEYDSQINHFLRQVEGPSLNLFRQRDNPLDSLLGLATNALNENQKLQEQLDAQVRFSQKSQKKNEELRRKLDEAESHLQHASMERGQMLMQHGNQIMELTQEHSRSMDDYKRKYDYDMSSTIHTYERSLKTLQDDHSNVLEGVRNTHADDLRKRDNKIEEIKATHAKEVERLVRQLLVNQQVDQGWTDDKLKVKFRELQRLIELVTAPGKKELLLPQNHQLGSSLDPNNFLDREGREKFHFPLKSAIWSVLYEQFFSAPFGFGVLGPGKAQVQLLTVYHSWLDLIDQRMCKILLHSTSRVKEKSIANQCFSIASADQTFAIFHHDKVANNWRSATFQCVNAALGAYGDGHAGSESSLAKLSADNVNQTVDRVIRILSEVSSMSNSFPSSETKDHIRQMANLGRDMALQFGLHPAQLRLLFPSRGERIQIGEEFHDCEDGDCNRGVWYKVDLVTTPGLRKIGGGRSDMNSEKIIVPCEIYPDQSSS